METQKNNQNDGIPVLFSQKKKKEVRRSVNSWYYFGLAGEIGFAVALPIAGGALIGKSIDERWQSYPKYTIMLLFSGIVLSMINFIMVVQNIIKQKH